MSRHEEQILATLQTIAELIDAQGRRVQPDIQTEPYNVNGNGLNIIIPGTQGQRIFICTLLLVTAGALSVTPGTAVGDTGGAFQPFSSSASSGGNAGLMALPTNAVIQMAVDFPQFLFRTEPGRAFALNLSAGTQVGGIVSYWKA